LENQDIVSRSSAEAKYRAMAHTACEMIWLKNLLMELGFKQLGPMLVHCDNQSAIYIAQNYVFREKTKHIEILSFCQRCVDQESGCFLVHTFFDAASGSSCLAPGVF